MFLDRPEANYAINIEMLFELEGLFHWLSSHLEVNAVCFSSTGNIFCSGFDQTELRTMKREKLHKYLVRFQRLLSGLQHLPQTVVCDMKSGASGMGIELAMASDIRIARKNCQVAFDFLQKGWVPCAGGISHLAQLVGPSLAKQWLLSSARLDAEQLCRAGLVLDCYEKQSLRDKILAQISLQSPVARIQAKRGLLEFSTPEWERGQKYELAFALAALESEDWKKNHPEEFISARQMAARVKQDYPN